MSGQIRYPDGFKFDAAAQPTERGYSVIEVTAQLGSVRISIANPDTDKDRKAIAGIAIWASVSETVDQRIPAQITAGVFPIRLRPDDWVSGDINWVLLGHSSGDVVLSRAA